MSEGNDNGAEIMASEGSGNVESEPVEALATRTGERRENAEPERTEALEMKISDANENVEMGQLGNEIRTGQRNDDNGEQEGVGTTEINMGEGNDNGESHECVEIKTCEGNGNGEKEPQMLEVPTADRQMGAADVAEGFLSKTEEIPTNEQNKLVSEGTPQNPEQSDDVALDTKVEVGVKNGDVVDHGVSGKLESAAADGGISNAKEEEEGRLDNVQVKKEKQLVDTKLKVVKSGENNHSGDLPIKQDTVGDENAMHAEASKPSYIFESQFLDGDDSGTEEEQGAFMKQLENFYRERSMEFKPPKFYGEGLNCLKLWRAVTRLGGYDQVTSCKLWRHVGESFRPPRTCTTVSWSFRCFYEKALLEYEKHKTCTGELRIPLSSFANPISVDNQVGSNQTSGSGRARRDAAARAMQGWHSHRLLGNGEIGDPIIKDKSPMPLLKRDKQQKSAGIFKRKKASSLEPSGVVAPTKVAKLQMETTVIDVGEPADWVKINVQRTKDCFEIYALVPGLLREEVHVQSDPSGRVVIFGEPEQPDNPWGVTPFKKIVNLPSRIDPHQTSAVVTLHGQLFVRAPYEQSDL